MTGAMCAQYGQEVRVVCKYCGLKKVGRFKSEPAEQVHVISSPIPVGIPKAREAERRALSRAGSACGPSYCALRMLGDLNRSAALCLLLPNSVNIGSDLRTLTVLRVIERLLFRSSGPP